MNLKSRLLSITLWFLLAWFSLSAIILFLQRFDAVTAISFQIAVRQASRIDGLVGCFYYDTGSGFSATEKTCLEYSRLPIDQFQNYLMTLPTHNRVRRVRFAPLREPGIVALSHLAVGRSRFLFTPQGYRFNAIDLSQRLGHSLYPVQQSGLSIEGETLVVRVSDAEGSFMLSDQLDSETGLTARAVIFVATIALIVCLGIAAGLAVVTNIWSRERAHNWRDALKPAESGSASARVAIVWLLAWVTIAALILFFEQMRTPTTVSFQIAIREANVGGDGFFPCFFYDTGSGFSEAETICFDYNRGPRKEFQTYNITLPTRRTVRRLRFDPLSEAGVVALRNVVVSKYRKAAIDPVRELGRTIYPLNGVSFTLENETLIAHLSAHDPNFMLSDDVDRRTGIDGGLVLYSAAISLVLCAFMFALATLVRRTSIWETNAASLRREVSALMVSIRAATLAALAALLLAMFCARVFALLTSMLRYGRKISVADLAAAPAESFAIGLLALALVVLAFEIERLCRGRWWTIPLRILFVGVELLAALVMVLLALFEVLCGYVFWEWGSYVDGTLIRIAYQSPTPDSLHYYLTRPPAAIGAIAILVLVTFGVFAFGFFRRHGISRRMVLTSAVVAAAWSLAALSPWRSPSAYDPSVSSPIFVALQNQTDWGEALDPKVIADSASFHLPPSRPVPAAYQKYHGAAAGQDVIFVVLESVRRSDLSLYGYPRETTPNLTRLAHHGMVFSNAYVSQPRSCKTMESITLGTYPDPRYESLVWEANRIAGRQSFWATLSQQGYRAYLGVDADVEYDGFGPFMRAALGPTLPGQ